MKATRVFPGESAGEEEGLVEAPAVAGESAAERERRRPDGRSSLPEEATEQALGEPPRGLEGEGEAAAEAKGAGGWSCRAPGARPLPGGGAAAETVEERVRPEASLAWRAASMRRGARSVAEVARDAVRTRAAAAAAAAAAAEDEEEEEDDPAR